jgi:predicted  nucleic acid-binding Zn-ribbon protein
MSASEKIDEAIDNLKGAIEIADQWAEIARMRQTPDIVVITDDKFEDMKQEIESAKIALDDAFKDAERVEEKVAELESEIEDLKKQIIEYQEAE